MHMMEFSIQGYMCLEIQDVVHIQSCEMRGRKWTVAAPLGEKIHTDTRKLRHQAWELSSPTTIRSQDNSSQDRR